jgi:hypothetical protein
MIPLCGPLAASAQPLYAIMLRPYQLVSRCRFSRVLRFWAWGASSAEEHTMSTQYRRSLSWSLLIRGDSFKVPRKTRLI